LLHNTLVVNEDKNICLKKCKIEYDKILKQKELCCYKGVNFTNILRAAFTHADPKSARKTDGLTEVLALLGSLRIKAAG